MADTRDANFRQYYVNAFNFVMNENEVVINLGMQKAMLGIPDEGNEFQIGVILSLRGAKTLADGLTQSIAALEKQLGVIEIPLEKKAEMEKAFSDAIERLRP